MRVSLFLSSVALCGALMVNSGRAVAQVDSTNQAKPELNSLPPDAPLAPPVRTPTRDPQVTPTPAPAQTPGTFQPARPAQPTATPPPARRPLPGDAGTPVQTTVKAESGPSKWFITGNPDLGFSSAYGYSFFNVGAAAMLGYRVTDRLALGPGVVYQYSSISGNGFSRRYSNVGGRVFGQALITEHFFAHAEHEILRVEVPAYDALNRLTTYRATVNSTFGGLGYRQQLGEDAAFDILVLYNFNQDNNGFIYGQPEFRFNLLFDIFGGD